MLVHIVFSLAMAVMLPGIAQRRAYNTAMTADDAYNSADFLIHHRCVTLALEQETIFQDLEGKFVSEDMCARTCASQAYTVFGIEHFTQKENRRCWCAEELLGLEIATDSLDCKSYAENNSDVGSLHFIGNITSDVPMIVHIFTLSDNNRHPGIFGIPKEFENKFFRDFAVRRHEPISEIGQKFNVTESSPPEVLAELRKEHADQLYDKYCANDMNKELKIIITQSGSFSSPFRYNINMLANWPSRAVHVVGGNEYITMPFSAALCDEFGVSPCNATYRLDQDDLVAAHIPQYSLPFFTQYWINSLASVQHNWFRFIPLWMRAEFLEVSDGKEIQILPPSERKYVYSYMASRTSHERKLCEIVMAKETFFNRSQKFQHVARKWSSDPNSPSYVHEDQYRAIMADSIFTLAPAGHNADQYRIYEAISTGSIPVVSSSQLASFSPEYQSSQMLVVRDWSVAAETMYKLLQDQDALLERQKQLMKWGQELMQNSVNELSCVLKERLEEGDTPLCQRGPYKIKRYCDQSDNNRTCGSKPKHKSKQSYFLQRLSEIRKKLHHQDNN
eukprot:m.108730 g.108730  ORF g.108730 m.108730 type:complete len:561 (+) comp13976_c1_seq3:629-2311(+)